MQKKNELSIQFRRSEGRTNSLNNPKLKRQRLMKQKSKVKMKFVLYGRNKHNIVKFFKINLKLKNRKKESVFKRVIEDFPGSPVEGNLPASAGTRFQSLVQEEQQSPCTAELLSPCV